MPVIIIGAGLAGLCAAIHLQEAGKEVIVLEKDRHVGGRIQTDEKDGFLLDRGFQVLLTAYPEAMKMLDYKALDLKAFDPGSIILHNGNSNIFADPLRSPSRIFSSLFAGVGTPGDFSKVFSMRKSLLSQSPDSLLDQQDRPTAEVLRERGFSNRMQERFFHPFYRGIFLEPSLHTSIGMFDFTFSMFAQGDAAIPAQGMSAIPEQLAQRVGMQHIRLESEVKSIESNTVQLADGSSLEADQILIAVDGWSGLLGKRKQDQDTAGATTCVYFSSPKAPFSKKLIALKSAPTGIVNNLTVMNNVAPAYAPAGQHLISVSVHEPKPLEDKVLSELVKQELSPWYGADVLGWKHLATYRIPHALPDQRSVRNSLPADAFKLGDKLYVAGDHLLNGSIHAAMLSGRLAAQAMLQ